jgi:hypothetical protein
LGGSAKRVAWRASAFPLDDADRRFGETARSTWVRRWQDRSHYPNQENNR